MEDLVAKVSLDHLPGGMELCSWLEAAPRRAEADFAQGEAGRLVSHSVKMESGVGAHGYVTRHVAITFALFGCLEVGQTGCTQPGRRRGMEIEATHSGIKLHLGGAQSWIKARRIQVSFAP